MQIAHLENMDAEKTPVIKTVYRFVFAHTNAATVLLAVQPFIYINKK